MEKHTLRRLILGVLQHMLAMCIMVALAMILFNSYLTVQTMDGPTTRSEERSVGKECRL